MNYTKRVGFIGAGKMAQALGLGVIASGALESSDVLVSAPTKTNFPPWESANVQTTHDNARVVMECQYVFLAVKPQLMFEALESIRQFTTANNVLIPIASGLSIDYYSSKFQDARIIRVMPNTPCCVQSGVCAVSSGDNITADELEFLKKLLSCVGLVIEVKESQMDAVCALAGSAPAFIFTAIDALSDGGVKMGLPRAMASQIAAHVVQGAAKLTLVSGKPPSTLKDDVCSPGGTTIFGIHELEKLGFRNALISAVESSTMQGVAISKLFNSSH